MRTQTVVNVTGMMLVMGWLSGCATVTESVVSAPDVSLRNVHVARLDLSAQTFVLSFDVTNPNPFPLPVNMIDYGVKLDGRRFASGETDCKIMVPAGSDSEIAISVDLNLLKTDPELLFIVRDAARGDIPYTLEGRMGVDLPATRPMRFEHEGLIRLQALAD
ncbi:MAG: LEA type 2 family protein [Woeseiaceae bacterium]|nr:LEA type 2 family protein [Woeseiaceae bacterium]